MTKMQFQAAAVRVQEEIDEEVEAGEDDKTLEFTLAGQDFELKVPTTTQIILLSTSTDEGTMRGMMSASMLFLEGLMLGDSYRRFRKLVANGTISQELLLGGDGANEQGVIDWIISQVTDARPTTSPTDSSQSPATTGKRSTGRAPGKGSILSASPSPAS